MRKAAVRRPKFHLADAVMHCYHWQMNATGKPTRCSGPGHPAQLRAPQWRDAPFSLHFICVILAAVPEAQTEQAQGYRGPQRRTCQHFHRQAPRAAFNGVLRAQPLHMLGPRLLYRAPLAGRSAHCETAWPAVSTRNELILHDLPELHNDDPELLNDRI